jgi:uncharacterized lipoprotein YddW (UPF0748 family)
MSFTRRLQALLVLAAVVFGVTSAMPRAEVAIQSPVPQRVDARAADPQTRASASPETRALWVLRTSLTSPEQITALVRNASSAGFNTLIVQVRGRGDAYFDSAREPRADQVPPGFDPLGFTLTRGHHAGLRVHAWVNVNLVASAVRLPINGSHVARLHPDWLMVPRDLAPILAAHSPTDPRYLQRLAEWTRAHERRVEGLYTSPIAPGAAREIEAVVTDLAARYPLQGIHLDYIRYPGPDFDYSPAALRAFRETIVAELSERDRFELDRRRAREPLIYADTFAARWSAYRRDRLTDLVVRLRAAVKTHRPEAILSAAVVPDADIAAADKFQDWRDWTRRGLLDVICPMAYTSDTRLFAAQVDAARGATAGAAVWAGIGAWRLTAAQTAKHVATARARGAEGVALFSYDSLIAGPARPASLAAVGRLSFAHP